MTRARLVAVLALSAALAPNAAAQSTSRESLDARRWRFELSGGAEVGPLAGWTTTRRAGDVRALSAGARWRSDDLLGARLGARWIHGRNPGYLTSVDDLLAVAGDVDLAASIPGTSITISPSVGLGFAPYVRHHRTDTALAQFVGPVTTAKGTIWTLGLALRWRRLVLEQHIIALVGANKAISDNKEYYPITLGWRF